MPRLFYAALVVSSFVVATGATQPVAADRSSAEQSECSSAPPSLQLANPNPGDVLQPGKLIVSGIAYDPAATNGAGIARVDLFLGDRDSGGTFLGSTAKGGHGSSLDREFQVNALLPSNQTGSRDFVAYAYSSMTGEWSRMSVPVFIGTAPSSTPANDTAPAQVPRSASVSSSCQGAVANREGSVSQPDECAGPSGTAPALPPTGFTDRTAEVSGANMHFVIGGNGRDVIVLLHGWPEDWYEWRLIMPSLAAQFTVLAVDLPGLGDSQGSPPSYDAKTLAGFVHGLVADTLGYQHVHIVGHDWGAPVAFAYAAFYREAASSLTMMGFPFFPGPGTDEQAKRGLLWWFGFNAAPALVPEQLVAGRQRTYLSWFYNNAVAPGNRLDPTAVAEYLRTYCRPSVLHGGFELYRAEPTDASDNTSLIANKLTLPVLYMDQTAVSGRLTAIPGDTETRKAQLVAPIQPMVAGLISVQLVPDAGHFVAEENPDFVSSQLTAFVEANSSI